MTASEEHTGSPPAREPVDRVRADPERGHRPAEQTPATDQAAADTADLDEDGDVASEHSSLTVADDPLDKPAESDATS